MNAKIIIPVLLIIVIITAIIAIIFFNMNNTVNRENREAGVFDTIRTAENNITRIDTYKINVKGVISKQVLFTQVGVNVDASGRVDNKNQRMQIEMNVSIPFSGTESTQLYVANDSIYSNQSGTWVKKELTGNEREYVWNKNNFLKRDSELMNSSETEVTGNETIDNVSLSVVKITPDKELLKNYVAALMEQFSAAVPKYRNLPDVSDIRFKNVTVKYWITKDTHLIVKEYFTADVVMAGDNYLIRISSEIYDYNKPVDINPPV